MRPRDDSKEVHIGKREQRMTRKVTSIVQDAPNNVKIYTHHHSEPLTSPFPTNRHPHRSSPGCISPFSFSSSSAVSAPKKGATLKRITPLNISSSLGRRRSPLWWKSGEALNSRRVTVGIGKDVDLDVDGGKERMRSTPKI